MNKVLFFIQAPRDLKYAIYLYDQVRETHEVTFYVVDHISNYQFLKSHSNVSARVEFVPNLSIKNAMNIIRERRRLPAIYSKEFSQVANAHVYFFSNFFDFKTFYFVSRLSKNNSVVFFDHYQQVRSVARRHNCVQKIKLGILKFITGLDFSISTAESIVIFDYEQFAIEKRYEDVPSEEIDDYRVRLTVATRALLLFDSNDVQSADFKNYQSVLEPILDILVEQGYTLYLKPHPRLGYSAFLDEYPCEMLDDNVPLELMDVSSFALILGNATAALAGCDNAARVVSIMQLLDFAREDFKRECSEYLSNLSPSIEFPKNQREINKWLIS